MNGTRDEPDVAEGIRAILAELAGDDAALSAPPGTPLLRAGLGLDSLRGALLLTRVREAFGVDIAGEDLNLDSLATIATLTTFVTDRITACRPGDNGIIA
ncbi:MAG TPA: acyl carrier protein [Streptosporangiaceae bacterium]|nr:acyl carrier protein [Streptosporangiaceae bacterium]